MPEIKLIILIIKTTITGLPLRLSASDNCDSQVSTICTKKEEFSRAYH